MKRLSELARPVNDLKVAVLGLTFKENVPDLRNSRVPDIIHELQEYGIQVLVHDPIAQAEEAAEEYGIHLSKWADLKDIDGMIVAVVLRDYTEMGLQKLLKPLRSRREGVVIDCARPGGTT